MMFKTPRCPDCGARADFSVETVIQHLELFAEEDGSYEYVEGDGGEVFWELAENIATGESEEENVSWFRVGHRNCPKNKHGNREWTTELEEGSDDGT